MSKTEQLFSDPDAPSTSSRSKSGLAYRKAVPKNPYQIPQDNEIFAIKEEMSRQKEDKRTNMNSQMCYLRGLKEPRQNFRAMTKIPPPKQSAEEEALAQLILTPDSNQATEGLKEFIDQKREIFFAQLAIDTKREELQRLERLEQEEEENLKNKEAEINLFRDQFRAFLESDGKATMKARHDAESKSKQRLEVSLKIKQVSSQISSLRNDIAHHEEKLQECNQFKDFIESLTPPEWRKKHADHEMYFTDPQQMVEIIQSLEDQNMFLIRHCQEAEEAVERYKTKFEDLLRERDGNLTDMYNARAQKQKSLEGKKANNEQYQIVGRFKQGNEIPESELQELHSAVSSFHAQLGFDNVATGDTITMLRRIETRMESLFIELQKVDQNKVKQMAQEKSHKRRDQERAAKAAQKQKEQEEKTQRALALATMPIKRKTGRPLLPRMCPEKSESREKREEQLRKEMAQKEADQNLLYGPIWD